MFHQARARSLVLRGWYIKEPQIYGEFLDWQNRKQKRQLLKAALKNVILRLIYKINCNLMFTGAKYAHSFTI